MCEWVTITDSNGQVYSEKSSDCNYCGCPNSDSAGKHAFYEGKCIHCGTPGS